MNATHALHDPRPIQKRHPRPYRLQIAQLGSPTVTATVRISAVKAATEPARTTESSTLRDPLIDISYNSERRMDGGSSSPPRFTILPRIIRHDAWVRGRKTYASLGNIPRIPHIPSWRDRPLRMNIVSVSESVIYIYTLSGFVRLDLQPIMHSPTIGRCRFHFGRKLSA